MGRRVDTDGKGDDPGEDDGRAGDNDGEPKAFAYDLGHRLVVFEADSHVALDEVGDPDHVLLPHGPVEAELLAVDADLFHAARFTLGLAFGDHGRQEVAGRQLDDDERDEADADQRRHHDDEPVDGEGDHGRPSSPSTKKNVSGCHTPSWAPGSQL